MDHLKLAGEGREPLLEVLFCRHQREIHVAEIQFKAQMAVI